MNAVQAVARSLQTFMNRAAAMLRAVGIRVEGRDVAFLYGLVLTVAALGWLASAA